MNNKIFDDMDDLIGNKMMQINLGLQDIKDFLDKENISLTTKTRDAFEGEDLKYVENIGNVLIRTTECLTKFLADYRRLKDTWQVTTA